MRLAQAWSLSRPLQHAQWSRAEVRVLQWCTLHEALHDALGPAWSLADTLAYAHGGHVRVPSRGVLWRNVTLPPETHVTANLRPSQFAALALRRRQRSAVVHADDALIVLDKPPALPTVATSDNASQNTLAWAREQRVVPPGAPLLVTSRLDAGTHGLLVVARTVAAQRAYNAALMGGSVEKRYECVVTGWDAASPHVHVGTPLEQWLSDPRVEAPREGEKMQRVQTPRVLAALVHQPPQRSIVRVQPAPTPECPLRAALVVESAHPLVGLSLAELAALRALRPWPRSALAAVRTLPGAHVLTLRLLTGRTHQIRAQLASMGAPVLGDSAYGCAHTALHAPAPLNAWALACVHLRFSLDADTHYDVTLPDAGDDDLPESDAAAGTASG